MGYFIISESTNSITVFEYPKKSSQMKIIFNVRICFNQCVQKIREFLLDNSLGREIVNDDKSNCDVLGILRSG